MRDNAKRRAERARRKALFEQLRLQADILDERNEGVILGRMLLIILDILGARKLNNAKREALADHFRDCSRAGERTIVELGGEGQRNTLYLDGAFGIDDLAKRLAWGEARTHQTIEVDNANSQAEGLS